MAIMGLNKRLGIRDEKKEKTQRNSDHDKMCLVAEKWLKSIGCKFSFGDRFGFWGVTQERPDAIGFMNDVSILVEVKVSRSDFLSDSKKPFRIDKDIGMGDWRVYMCPPGVIEVRDLPKGWGLVYCTGNKTEQVFGLPIGNSWHQKPFKGNKRAEMSIMYSAIRRAAKLGYMEEIKNAYRD